MKNTKIIAKLTLTILIFGSNYLSAELAIIVSPDSNVSSITEKQVQHIYLGKRSKFPDDSNAKPLDMPEGSTLRNEFYSKIIHKNASQVKSYWARKIFSGKGKPPPQAQDADDMKETVSLEEDAIGYLDSSDVDESVKVVLTLP